MDPLEPGPAGAELIQRQVQGALDRDVADLERDLGVPLDALLRQRAPVDVDVQPADVPEEELKVGMEMRTAVNNLPNGQLNYVFQKL